MHDPVKKRESNNDETNSGELWSFCIILSCGHELVLTITFYKKFSPSRLRCKDFENWDNLRTQQTQMAASIVHFQITSYQQDPIPTVSH